MDDDERTRIEQSNAVAAVVFDTMQRHGMFAYLGLRYDIADAIWAAGYRKAETSDPSSGRAAGLEALGKASSFTAAEFADHLQRFASAGPKATDVVAALEHLQADPTPGGT